MSAEPPYTKELQRLLDALNQYFCQIEAAALVPDDYPDYVLGQYLPKGDYTANPGIWVDQWVSSSTNDLTTLPNGSRVWKPKRIKSSKPRERADVFHIFFHEFAHHLDIERNQRDWKAEKGDFQKQHNATWKAAFREIIEWVKKTTHIEDENLRAEVIRLCENDEDLLNGPD